jgi:hypothetical protein
MSSLRTEDDLRSLFADDAEDVCTSAEMLSRVAVRRRQRSWLPALAACAAVAAVAVIVVALTSSGTNKQPTPPVANTVPGNWHTVSYPIWHIALKAPPEWRSYQYSVPHDSLIGYLSTAPLHDPCVRTTTSTDCSQPIDHLTPDDLLIGWGTAGDAFTASIAKLRGGERIVVGGRAARISVAAANEFCAGLGGDTSITVAVGSTSNADSHIAFRMDGCLGSDADQSDVRTMLRTVRFATHAATAIIGGRLLAVGGPAPGTAHPLPGTVILRSPGSEITVPVGKTGRYSAEVPPGRYEVDGHSPLYGSGKYSCRALKPVTPAANGTTTANVYCQYA